MDFLRLSSVIVAHSLPCKSCQTSASNSASLQNCLQHITLRWMAKWKSWIEKYNSISTFSVQRSKDNGLIGLVWHSSPSTINSTLLQSSLLSNSLTPTPVKDASSTRVYSFLPASRVGDTHEETDVLPISDQEETRWTTTRPSCWQPRTMQVLMSKNL